MKHKLTAQELGSFCRQLGILIHSGMGPLESLHILLEESEADTDHEILSVLLSSMEKTGSLSQAITDSGFFPNSMAAYIKTGEQTGCLDEILDSLSGHYEQEQETSGQIRSAVTYPLLMLVMMGIVIIVLLVKVLPIFRQVFQQMGMEMNGFSSRLLNAGNIITRYSAFFLILAVILIGCILFLCLNKKGQQMLAKIVLHLPVLRDIPVALDYSRMTHGLALGQKSGLAPETSLALAEQLISHPLVLERLQKAADLLNTGYAFSDAL